MKNSGVQGKIKVFDLRYVITDFDRNKPFQLEMVVGAE